jgi:glycosyltransferase involved in cell wall biosynthesis
MKALVSAFSCEPGQGGEPGAGWNCVRQAARFHEVWVLTWGEQRPAVERALSVHPLPNAHFVYLDLPRLRGVWGLGWLGKQIFYYVWQIAAYLLGRRLHRQENFDLVHHMTFGCYWRPIFLALLPAPFLWGPVGGGESAPRAFWPSFSLRGKIIGLARDLGRKMGECDPFVRHTARKARLGLATTEETAARMRKLGCREVSVLPQSGLPGEEIAQLGSFRFRQSNPFRLVSIGRLLHWKGFELGLRGFARFQSRYPATEYWIIGDGPERKRLHKLAQRLGVAGSVTFWGLISRRQALEKLTECDVLVHPSLHDSGGWVCLEAMAAGRPVICLDLGGPGLQVTDETGIKVPACTPDQAVADLAAAMVRLATDPILREAMGRASQRRVEEHFDWDRKGEFLARAYADIVRGGCAQQGP